MIKVKELYRSKHHISNNSHDVIIIQESKVNGIKLKMTYEAYNAAERFTGEQYVGGKWEHLFSMLDLGISPNTSIYVHNETTREKKTEELIKKGTELFNIINK